MKRKANNVRFLGTVESLDEASGLLEMSGDAVLIARGRPRLLLLSCPCGCGEHFPVNLDPHAGPAWRIYGNPEGELSLYPSVWRKTDCKSHYIIWRGQIFLGQRNEDQLDGSPSASETDQLVELVRQQLPEKSLLPFSEIAETVGAIPWDVLMACRRLVEVGVAREGTGNGRGSFGQALSGRKLGRSF